MKTTETLQQNHSELTDATIESEVFHFDTTVAEIGHVALDKRYNIANKRIGILATKMDPSNEKLFTVADDGDEDETNEANFYGSPQARSLALTAQYFNAERQSARIKAELEAKKQAIEEVYTSRVHVSHIPTSTEVQVRYTDIPSSEYLHDEAA